MKKPILFIMSALLLISASACGSTTTIYKDKTLSESESSVQSSVAESSDESRIQKRNWLVKYYVDKFGDETDKPYLFTGVLGTFSNSATDGSDLLVEFLIEPDETNIMLFEYGSQKVKNYYSDRLEFSISTKNDAGETNYFIGKMVAESGDRIYLLSEDHEEIIKDFKKSKTVKFVVENKKHPQDIYKFEVNCGGFEECYNEMLKK